MVIEEKVTNRNVANAGRADGHERGERAARRDAEFRPMDRRTVTLLTEHPAPDRAALSEEITADSIIDAIALIELQRQEMHRESDPEAWRNRALGKLQAILQQLEEAQRLRGPSAEHFSNTEAVTTAIGRVKASAATARQRPMRKGSDAKRPDGSLRNAARQPTTDRGRRRTIGRRSR